MTAKLLYSRNPNPRLAVATARHLGTKVAFEFAAPRVPGQTGRYRALNPNLLLRILIANGKSLWETDAIACRLSATRVRISDAATATSRRWPTGSVSKGWMRRNYRLYPIATIARTGPAAALEVFRRVAINEDS